MANKYLDSGSQRAARVHELFSGIARRYDLINDLQSFGLHRFWKRRVLKLASVQPCDRALDVCCGTGDLALGLARRGANVVGLDFNQRMLEVAELRKSKVQSLSSQVRSQEPQVTPQSSCTSDLRLPNLQFVRGDAQQIPFPDNSFHVVTMGY